jgi:succinoglycan biosynthesis protein ExoA
MPDADSLHTRDRVAVVVPTFNEQDHIGACLRSLLEQAEELDACVLVADGGSDDKTPAIVMEMAEAHPTLALIVNPKRLQSAAINLAERCLPQDVSVLVRADAHALYPPRFLADCVRALRDNCATSVVVPMRATGITGYQRAIAAAQNGRLGNGGASHRCGGISGDVEHGHHAAFDRAFFRRIGGYDERFSHNEDAEFDLRARRAGGRIWMCRDAEIVYLPRTRLHALARQYLRHGCGRARTVRLHRVRPRLRQLLPPLLLVSLIGSTLLTPVALWTSLLPLAYAATCGVWATAAASRARDPWLLVMAPAVMTMHLAWAAGFLLGLSPFAPKTARARTTVTT